MAKFLRTISKFNTYAEAAKVAEAVFQETRGMFVSLEGDVWISFSESKTMEPHYEVWVIQNGDDAYIPTTSEMVETCEWVGLPMLHVTRRLKSFATLTKMRILKWKRYS